ncbi:DNA primase TraC [Citrobacter koseri]|uniref:DNA primase TraC n=1 Tax=Citrobacter koseri TaxID=545 RepID=A0A3S4J6C2_CITKO|nr:DNA primase TraC [Citrobacter koseri]
MCWGIDCRAAQTSQQAASQRRVLETERQQRELERQQKATADAEHRRKTFIAKYQPLRSRSSWAKANTLLLKGWAVSPSRFSPMARCYYRWWMNPEQSTVAQTITPMGAKRLLTGSAKKGAYHAVNTSEAPEIIIIAEGLATVLSAHMMRPDALAVAAIDAWNLTPVVQVMRRKYPDAKIIIAADNDQLDDKPNTGADTANKAAISVSGWVSLPPTDYKADWNDYHQQKRAGSRHTRI